MRCDPTLERLPWLLNGTLPEVERREVLDHLTGCAACRQALEESRLAWQVFDQHLPAAALVAYAADEDGTATLDSGLVERHLATCPQCAAELELARMSRRLVEDESIALLTARPERSARQVHAPAAVRWRAWRGSALAAGLAAVVALSGWINASRRVHSLEHMAARVAPATAGQPAGATLDRPASQAGDPVQINWVARSLQPRGAVERGAPSGQVEEIPASAPMATLMLTLPGGRAAENGPYELEIRDDRGRSVYHRPGLRRDPQLGDLVISLRPQSFPKGAYELEVLAAGHQGPVASYSFRID